MKLNKVIGIISYLTPDLKIRKLRYEKLNKLVEKCNQLFNLPIIIVAQNYLEKEIHTLKNKYPNCLIFDNVHKLGITGARKKLREIFLNSSFDYLIMLDDDCELSGSSGEIYLKQIDNNPGCFIEFNKTLLKLFAISKTLFSKIDYDDINPENGEGFEDRIFVNKLRAQFPEKRREFIHTGIGQHSLASNDELSTWYTNQNLKQMLKKTMSIINQNKC